MILLYIFCMSTIFWIFYFIIWIMKESVYDIVYKPLSKRYYPRCNKYYIYYWNNGKYSLENNPVGCEYSHTVDGAKELIDKYKESLGINDEIIKI